MAPYLAASGRITDPSFLPQVIKIMLTRTADDDRMELIELLDKSRSPEMLASYVFFFGKCL